MHGSCASRAGRAGGQVDIMETGQTQRLTLGVSSTDQPCKLGRFNATRVTANLQITLKESWKAHEAPPAQWPGHEDRRKSSPRGRSHWPRDSPATVAQKQSHLWDAGREFPSRDRASWRMANGGLFANRRGWAELYVEVRVQQLDKGGNTTSTSRTIGHGRPGGFFPTDKRLVKIKLKTRGPDATQVPSQRTG